MQRSLGPFAALCFFARSFDQLFLCPAPLAVRADNKLISVCAFHPWCPSGGSPNKVAIGYRDIRGDIAVSVLEFEIDPCTVNEVRQREG